MSDKIDISESKLGSSSYARAVTASALLVPLAAFLGGVKLPNHNETVVRDAGPEQEPESSPSGKAASTYARGVTAFSLLVPLAAFVGGMNLGNHNETVVRDVFG